MGIREPHPAGDRDLPVTHVYKHPDGHDLGRHHVGLDDPPLATRMAHPNTPPDWPRSLLTQEDLDLPHGTELSHVDTDEDTGHLIFAWTDRQGDARRTSFTPEQARRFLTVQDGTEGQAG